jgi:hypothetical protein
VKRRQCSHCGGIVGVDIMEDEWTPEGVCAPCFMSIETGEPPEGEEPLE